MQSVVNTRRAVRRVRRVCHYPTPPTHTTSPRPPFQLDVSDPSLLTHTCTCIACWQTTPNPEPPQGAAATMVEVDETNPKWKEFSGHPIKNVAVTLDDPNPGRSKSPLSNREYAVALDAVALDAVALDAVACDLLCMLTCAVLMTSSQSKIAPSRPRSSFRRGTAESRGRATTGTRRNARSLSTRLKSFKSLRCRPVRNHATPGTRVARARVFMLTTLRTFAK